MHTGTTITQFIIEEQRGIEGATGDFTSLLNDIVTACKVISNRVDKGELIGVLGTAGSEHVQGETQKKLDILTNEVFLPSNEWAGHLSAMASASMLAEVHRMLTRGGISRYPIDDKMKAKGTQGKLRLLYGADPMSLIVGQAGGASSTGRERIMGSQPEYLHQRAPVILGSVDEVERVVSHHNEPSAMAV